LKTSDQIEKEYLSSGNVTVVLSIDETKYLQRLLNAWHNLLKYKSKSIFTKWLFYIKGHLIWRSTLNENPEYRDKVREIFSFYAYYQDGHTLGVKTKDVEQNGLKKAITFFDTSIAWDEAKRNPLNKPSFKERIKDSP